MNQFLNQYDFTLALNSNNAEFIWLYLKTVINSALNLYVPKISVKKSNNPFGSTQMYTIKSSAFALLRSYMQDILQKANDSK